MVNRKFKHLVRAYGATFTRHSIEWLLPERCHICDALSETTQALCKECRLALNNQRLTVHSSCARCALPLTAGATSRVFCAWCISQRPIFERCIAANVYASHSARLVNSLKHSMQLPAARIIADEMARTIKTFYGADPSKPSGAAIPISHVDLVVPVPLHRRRLRQRGFNQAIEIAKPLCRQLSLPLAVNACQRLRDAHSQQGLSRRQRARNLRGAFTATCEVTGKHVALLDDVVTTTSTANAAAQSLLDAGAISCEVWCFARTPAPD